jgi:hypothetical protein
MRLRMPPDVGRPVPMANREARLSAGPAAAAGHGSTSTEYRSLVVDQPTALRLTAAGIGATTVPAILSAPRELLAVYVADEPAIVFVRDPLPPGLGQAEAIFIDEIAAIEKVRLAGGRVKVVKR